MREPNGVSIRMADVTDAGTLAELGRRTFHETFAAQNDPEDMDAYLNATFTVEGLAGEIREPGAAYLVAEDHRGAVGFAKVAGVAPPDCVTAPSPLRLARLYVSAEAIGAGVGAALMRACIERARATGHLGLWLGVWEHNHRAIAFYRRWGFEAVGNEVFLLGRDEQTDLVMQLALDHPPE